jgi:uncharacterized protein (DUF1778 family)
MEVSMSTDANSDAGLNFRLPAEFKQTIELAAAELGQTVSDFAVSTLVRKARHVLREMSVTRLSNRDRDIFIAMLDDVESQPNERLLKAAANCKDEIG